ncbi:MAG: sulfatase [Candidatus Aminicenantes bacterium]|nr:sulfatase [Candidatus Aminicenantes bacterium]
MLEKRRRFAPAVPLIFAVVLGFTLTLIPSGCSGKRPRQAVLILLDAARPDHFSCYGYGQATTPEMDRLASGGMRVNQCYTQGTYTRSALPALLYSRYYAPNMYPSSPYVPLYSPNELFEGLDEDSISLPKALELNGFKTAAVSAHSHIKPQTSFAAEFQEFYDLNKDVNLTSRYPYPSAETVMNFVIDWIKANRKSDFFLYVHLMDTHFPHYFTDEAGMFYGEAPYTGDRFIPGGWLKDDGIWDSEDKRYLYALYDGSLHSADRQIGRLVRAIGKGGRLKSTLIAVTSDHGEMLLDRDGKIGHGGGWYEPVARIPLIIHYPERLESVVLEGPAEMVDIAPTICGLLEADIPRGKTMDGQVLGLGWEEKESVFIRGGIRSGRYKCLFTSSDQALLNPAEPDPKDIEAELYDLETDGEERITLRDSRPDVLRNMILAYRDGMTVVYLRSRGARRGKQPNSAFAVSCRHFDLRPSPTPLSPRAAPEDFLSMPSENGWFLSADSDYFWLVAAPGARPLTVSFPVPDGRYVVMMDINGACRVTINGEERALKSPVFSLDLPWDMTPVEFGPVEITGERLEAVFHLQSKRPWFGLRFFGLIPESLMEETESNEYRKRQERLRALGYIK